jgi:hypothetical protein
MTLHDFLQLDHRFRWGGSGRPILHGVIENDCTTFCATWVENLTGTDPAAELRGTYRTAEGAQAIVDASGGLVRFMAAKLEPLGFRRIQQPDTGDIGVIKTLAGMEGEIKEIGAIRFGPLWATLGPSGVAAKKVEFIAAWRAP